MNDGDCMRGRKVAEPIPERFESIEAAAEWWDNHSLAEYWDRTAPADFDVRLMPKGQRISVDRDLLEPLGAAAQEQGVTLEELVNRWLREKLGHTNPAA